MVLVTRYELLGGGRVMVDNQTGENVVQLPKSGAVVRTSDNATPDQAAETIRKYEDSDNRYRH